MGQSLKFTVEVAADKADATLKALAVAASQAGVEMRTKLLGVGPAANAAGAEIESLGEKMRKFASEERQEGRTAGFFVNELTKIVPASSEAKAGLGALAEIMVGGAGVGAAMAVAGAAAEILSEAFNHQEESLKAAREAAKQHAEALDRIAEIQNRTRRLGLSSGGVSEEVAIFDSAAAALRKLRREYDELERQRDEAVKKRRPQDVVQAQRRMEENAAEQKALREQMRAEERRNDNARAAAITRAEDAVALESAVGEEEKVRIEYAQRIAEIQQEISLKLKDEALGNLEINRVIAEREKKLRDIRTAEAAWRARAGEEYGKSEDANLLYRGDPDAMKKAMAYAHRPDTSGQPSVGGFYSLEAAGYDEKEIAKQREKMFEKEQKDVNELAASYEKWGNVAAGAMVDVATGQATVGEATRRTAMMIAQTLIQMGVQKLAAEAALIATERPLKVSEAISSAGVAGAEGAAAVAGIPIVGPAMAAAVAASLPAEIMSATVPLASAAGGWQVPYDTLAMVHKDEKILPARYSRGLDRLVANGGGGAPLIGTVIATDAQSFGRQLQRRDSDLTMGLERAARRRRIARV